MSAARDVFTAWIVLGVIPLVGVTHLTMEIIGMRVYRSIVPEIVLFD